MPPRRGYLKPPARIIRRGSRILRPLVTGAVSPITKVGTDGTTAATVQDTTPTTAWPSGITDGDLVVLEVTYGSGATPTTISQASGATMTLASDLSDTSIRTATYTRFFVTGDTAPTFTLSTARSWATKTTAFRGVDTVHRFGPNDNDFQQTAQASSTSYASGSLTPDEDLAMAVLVWGGKIAAGGTQTITVASGWTDTGAINQCNIAATTNVWCDIQYQALGTAAATSESVTIGTAAVGQGTILALNPAPAGGALSRTAADTASATDTATRSVAEARTAADTASASDSAPRIASFARSASDTASATDTAVGVGGGNSRTASDAASATDTASRTLGLATRTTADTASALDTVTRTAPKTRTTADTASASDTATRTWAAARTATETASATDAGARLVAFARSASDTATAADAATRTAPRIRTASDTASATDTAAGSTSGNLQRTATDTTQATDTATRSAITWARSTADTAQAVDAATRTAPRTRIVSDTAAAADVAVGVVNHSFTRTAADTANAADTASGTVVAFTVGQLTATLAALTTLTAADAPTATLTATATRGGPT
jgi:epidermal growth factor receptor substrate 15